MVFALFVVGLAYFIRPPFRLVGKYIGSEMVTVSTSVIIASAALCAVTFSLSRNVLHPSDEHRQILVAWPDYWKLALRVRAAFLWNLFGGTLAVVGLVAIAAAHNGAGATLLLSGLTASIASLCTVANASLSVRDELDSVAQSER